jgi:hypothetical protein
MGNDTTLGALVGVPAATSLVALWKKQWLPAISETRTVRMLRVTAVLMADDDGGRATGVLKQGGTVIPQEGLLRNAAVHSKLSANYIDDWISLANKQLWVSGADFLLDRSNVRYVLAKNTAANSYVCGDSTQPVLDLIASRQKAKGDNPWKDSLLMIFPWGGGEKPEGQGCADVASPFLKMAAKYHDVYKEPRFVDGKPVPGNNLLTHELGHFLGLSHNFPEDLQAALVGLAFDPILNPNGVTLTEANVSQFNGLTKADVAPIRAKAKKFIATWVYALDQDFGYTLPGNPPGAPALTDTPINLGMGLPAVMGHTVGTGNHLYELERFGAMTGNAGSPFGTPIGDGNPFNETVPLNQDVRLNAMGYWYSNVLGQKFSKQQVARMEFVVGTKCAAMIDRTSTITASVGATGLTVSQDVFSMPQMLLEASETMQLTIRKPTQREIDSAVAKVRRPTPALGRHVARGNQCGLRAKGVRVR